MSVHTELIMLYVFKVSITGCMCLFFCQLKQKQGVYKPAVLEELKRTMLLAEEICPGITDSMVTGVVQRLKRYLQHPACIAQYVCESDVFSVFSGFRLNTNWYSVPLHEDSSVCIMYFLLFYYGGIVNKPSESLAVST